MSESDRLFFIEQMDATIQQIGEMIAPLAADIAWMKPKVARIDAIEQDIKMMKFAITETNKDLSKTRMGLASTIRTLADTNRTLDATIREMKRNNNATERRLAKLEHI